MATAATFKEWNGTALVPLTLSEVGDRAVLRKNLAPNPSMAANTNGYGRVTGTGGVAALTWQSGPGADGKPGFARITWTTASTSGGGYNLPTNAIPVPIAIGDRVTLQAMIRIPIARTVNFGGYPKIGTTGSAATQAKLFIPANSWTLVTVSLNPSPITADNVYMYCYFDGTTSAPGVGEYMDMDLVQAEAGAVATPYLDGDMPDTADYLYEWTGAVNASPSVERDARGGTFTALIV